MAPLFKRGGMISVGDIVDVDKTLYTILDIRGDSFLCEMPDGNRCVCKFLNEHYYKVIN